MYTFACIVGYEYSAVQKVWMRDKLKDLVFNIWSDGFYAVVFAHRRVMFAQGLRFPQTIQLPYT
jgi:hypothetical protein